MKLRIGIFGLMILFLTGCNSGTTTSSNVSNETIYVGTYNNASTTSPGLYSLRLDNNNNVVSGSESSFNTANPSYLFVQGSNLYAVNEVETGTISHFILNVDKSIAQAAEVVTSGGDAAVYLKANESAMFVANYGNGANVGSGIASIKLGLNGTLSNSPITNIVSTATNSHTHSVYPITFAGNNYLTSLDLGTDQMHIYALNTNQEINNTGCVYESNFLESCDIQVESGSGPRHLTYVNKGDIGYFYVVNETNSTISVYSLIQNEESMLSISNLQNILSYDSSENLDNIKCMDKTNYPGEIAFLNNNIYVSNRGLDNIAQFNIESDGNLMHITDTAIVESVCAFPRDFDINAAHTTLITANQKSNDLSVFSMDENGRLTFMHNIPMNASSVGIKFYK